MNDSTDWHDIIQKHLDGQTSGEEATALSDQIVRDDSVRSDYLKAARLHGALNDETLELDREAIPFPQPEPRAKQPIQPLAWSRLAAAIVTGAFVGITGIGMVWAMNSPRSEASYIPIANGNFQSVPGPVASGFPDRFGYWSGNPAEVVEEPDGNQALRFLETGNVMGIPDGGASNCSVFQWVDLSALQSQWKADRSECRLTLELSARFRREAAPTDADLPKLDASVRIYLFQGDLDSLSNQWPEMVREADALGKQAIQLSPGDSAATISTSCLFNPEATMALIAVSANTRSRTTAPVELGGYYVDDVQLTAIKQPNLPVRFVE